MLLSDTPWGQLWLNNFALSDRATASLLLDALQLVGQDALRDGLLDLISGLPNRLETPIALVPVRALAPGQFYFPHGRNSKPRLLLPQSLPGSEAVIANILTSAPRWRTFQPLRIVTESREHARCSVPNDLAR